jgi:hypothetical protein
MMRCKANAPHSVDGLICAILASSALSGSVLVRCFDSVGNNGMRHRADSRTV